MDRLRQIFNENRGICVSSRGRRNRINLVIRELLIFMPKHDNEINNQLINKFCREFSFIKKIDIDGDSCIISYFDDNDVLESICFSNVSPNIKRGFRLNFYNIFIHLYCFENRCHSVSVKYLKLNRKRNIRSVTSLCVDMNNRSFFHSYIWDVDNNLIIDFSRNIMMNKIDFDYIFVLREINVFDYDEYLMELGKENYRDCGGDYCRLLFLALARLYFEENDVHYCDEKSDNNMKGLCYCIDYFLRNGIYRSF